MHACDASRLAAVWLGTRFARTSLGAAGMGRRRTGAGAPERRRAVPTWTERAALSPAIGRRPGERRSAGGISADGKTPAALSPATGRPACGCPAATGRGSAPMAAGALETPFARLRRPLRPALPRAANGRHRLKGLKPKLNTGKDAWRNRRILTLVEQPHVHYVAESGFRLKGS